MALTSTGLAGPTTDLPPPPESLHRLLPHGGSLPLADWQRRHRMIVGLLWFSILGVTVYAAARQTVDPLRELPAAVSIILCALLTGPRVASRKWRSIAASLGLLIAAAALVDISGGLIEMHFAFFVVVVVLTLYEDWIPFLLAVAFVLLHHGIMGSVDPQAVFNRPQEWRNPWPWAALHAVFIAMAGAAGVTAWRLNEQVRERMRTAQAELARILDAAGNAVYGLDRDGLITFANPEALRMTGHRADELVGRTLHAMVHHTRSDGTAYPFSECPVSKALAYGTVHDGDGDVYWRKDGTSFPVEISCTPILDHGRVTGAVVVAKDITDRREVERAREEFTAILEQHGAQLNEAQAVAQVGSWEWEVGADAMIWSDELCRIFGLEPGGQPATMEGSVEALHPDDRARVAATIEASCASCDPFAFDARLVLPGGEVRVIHCAGEVRDDGAGKPLRMLGTAQDVTERERMQAEMRRSSRFVEVSRDLVCTIGFDGHLEQFNAAWTHTLGWTERELRSRPFLDLVHPDDRADTECTRARLEAGEPAAEFLNRCATTAGDWRWLEWNAIAVPDEQAIYASARDVTDRKATEVALAGAHAVALEASRLKSEFLANMSHEIRTPLNGVIGMGGLLLDTQLDEEQREYVEAVGASGEALMSVVNDILDFSKIEAGKLELDRHPFELREVVDDVWSMLATTAHDKNLELVSWVDERVPDTVCGDSARVRQVLTNLATNAIKFTTTGDIVVRVTSEPLDGRAIGVRFAVTDTGIGVEPDARERIFDAFAQADNSTTRRFGGTGLGLAICRRLVDLMGGTIGVESEPGVGSTFWFTIPLPPAPAGDAGPARPDFGGARVLIADESLTSRVILDHQLSAWHLECDTAADPDEALRLLTRAALYGTPYALAVIDVRAPTVGGMRLARAIKATSLLRSTRLLMLSAAGSMRETATDAGIEGFLTKPARHQRLAHEIGRLLDGDDRAPKRSGARRAPAPARAADLGRPVLLAEDNQVNRLVAVKLLERRGFQVDVARNGRDAVRMHHAGRYDLIFMDCQMPELDGYAATAEIRRAEAPGEHTQIIAMTANTLKGDRERCLSAGMDDYLAKPLHATELETVIARALAAADHAGGAGAEAGAPRPPLERQA
jgi:two-component system sensor histidine kinase/response regulator